MAAKRRKAENAILASVHETAIGLHGIGLVDKSRMREFEALCLVPIEPPAPAEIRVDGYPALKKRKSRPRQEQAS